MMQTPPPPMTQPIVPKSGRRDLPMSPDELQDPFMCKVMPPETQDPLVYCMVLLGATAVITWSIVYLAVDDLNRVFPGQDTEYRLAAAYKTTNFIIGIFVVVFGPRFSFRARILPAFCVQALAIVGLIVISECPWPSHHMLMLVMVFAGAGQALSHGSLWSLCSTCPERYMRSFVVGLGASAIVVGILKVMSKSIFVNPVVAERLWLAVLFSLYLVATFCYVRIVDADVTVRVCAQMARDDSEARRPLASTDVHNHPGTINYRHYYRVFKQVKWVLGLMILNWTVSFSVFPGMTADLDSSSQMMQKSGWYHVLLMFTFVLFDVMGRMVTCWIDIRELSVTQLFCLTLARGLFVPTFLLINKFDGNQRMMDFVTFFFMGCLALTNGTLVSICSVMPVRIVERSEREMAGSLSFLSYICGQSLGVIAALIMKLSGVVPEF